MMTPGFPAAGGPPPSAGPTLQWVRAGWLIDGRGGPRRPKVWMALRGDQLVYIGPDDRRHEAFLDLSHATVLPALIDAHVHLVFSGTLDAMARRAQLQQTPQQALAAIRRHLQDHRRCGIAAVRDGGDRRGDVLQYRRQHLDGGASSVHLAAGRTWHAAGRYGAMLGQAPPAGVSLAQDAQPYLEAIDHVKVIQSGLNSLDRFGHQGPPQFGADDLRALVKAAHAARRPVMVHANGEPGVRTAVEAGCDSIEHGYFMGDDNLRRMADQGTVWVPTAVPMATLAAAPNLTARQQDVARRTLDAQLEQIRKAREFGMTIALGTDAGSLGVDHGSAVREELSLLMTAGLGLEEAIACATGIAAGLLGLTGRGTLNPGRRSDFIAVTGPPEQLPGSLAAVEGVCLGGVWRKSDDV
jgi:imidazolonepropionase-like amidohydrolase